MNIGLFLTTLVLTITITSIAMLYLRFTTRQVIIERCQSEVAADFWLKSADVLAYSGASILVLVFGYTEETQSWTQTLRLTLILSLSGVFITVVFIASNVWKSISFNMGGSK